MTNDKTIEFSAKLMREPYEAKSENFEESSYEWLVKINGQSFKFYTGSGIIKKTLGKNMPIPPTLDDVLNCLVSDAEAENCGFEEWCDNFGYEKDSRKALRIYLACQETATKLRKAKINIEAERERLNQLLK